MNVVLDTNVIVSAIFWPGEARNCLALWAKRRFALAVTEDVLDEYQAISQQIAQQLGRVNPDPWLVWIRSKAKIYAPAATGKQRSRDGDDDSILSCALASAARFIVSRDDDLLVLGKPFGIAIVTPRVFLSHFTRQERAPKHRGRRRRH